MLKDCFFSISSTSWMANQEEYLKNVGCDYLIVVHSLISNIVFMHKKIIKKGVIYFYWYLLQRKNLMERNIQTSI